jgi:8-oxo-dGTP diphosphatase
MIRIIVGCIVVKGDSFVLVQEAKKSVYGKWNLPLGHLEEGEDIIAGAIRESQEETGLKINIKGFVGVYNRFKSPNTNIIMIVFEATTKNRVLKFKKGELLDAKWVSYNEFKKIPQSEMRGQNIIAAINDYFTRGSISLDYIKLNGFK